VGDCDQRPHGNHSRQYGLAGVDPDLIPVVTRDRVKYAKPDPNLLLAAAERPTLSSKPHWLLAIVSGACWRRSDVALGVGLLSGGDGSDELRQSGAFPRL
jgi:hypothetical protein